MKWLVFSLVALTFVAGEAAAQDTSISRSYAIGPRDKIQIRVEELPDLNTEQVVAEDGTVVLPIVGTLRVQGLTEDEVALRLRARLESEGLRKATVTARVTDFRSRPVSILGAVASPGNHYIPRRATLMEVLLDAGGLAENHGSEIHVRRRSDNGLSDQIEIPVRDLVEIGDPALNIPIFAGDTINVLPAGQLTVHFLGQVQNPGSVTFSANQRVTLLTAIARAGGLLETAARKIRIKRQNRSGDPIEIVADYRQVLNGRVPDVELENGDLIIVKESFF